MKTRDDVIDFIKNQSVYGNSIVYTTIGNGGCGLVDSSFDFSSDLDNMYFNGKVEPCNDIKNWTEYDANMYSVYQFSDDNGLKIQIVIF